MDHERSTSGDILESAIETRARVGEAINSSLRVLNRSDISLRMVFGHFTFLKLSTAERLNARGDCAEKSLISEIGMDMLTAKRKICPGKAR